MRFILSFFFLLFSCNFGYTQDSTTKKPAFTFRLYLDAYYSYDFNKPSNSEKPPFLYNHKRHKEISANLALVGFSYQEKSVRVNVGLMTGSYSRYNLANEPRLLRNLFEANAGIKLSKNRNLWLDLGTMPSHIGFESAISKDCWTLTRSILAENTPYYETGIRLSQTSKNDKLYSAILLLNGWQRIEILQTNLIPAFGTQVTYKPISSLSINWSTFLGKMKPDSSIRWRFFNNFYAVYQLSKKIGITVGLDHGFEQKYPGSGNFNTWYSPIIITRFATKEWSLAARIEYYYDKFGIVVPLVNNQFFKMQGYSLNVDRKIGRNSMWRIEWRYLNNSSPYFLMHNGYGSKNHCVTSSFLFDLIK